MNDTTYRHWHLERDTDGVCWLSIDRADDRNNTLSGEVLAELERVVAELEDRRPRGLVLQSAKAGQFIMGADVREFDEVDDAATAAEQIRRVHRLFNRIEALSFPKVVTIEGFCLGGGLELSLCFDYRIARNDDRTRIGFPEVNLGIYPGFGGSARSVALIGGKNALTIMLTGRLLRAPAARGMGLVDQLVGTHGELRWAARKAIFKGLESKGLSALTRLQNSAPARRFLAKEMRKQTRSKANPAHYPAPYALIDAFEAHGDDPQRMMAAEVDNVSRLIVGDTSRNLRRVFALMERLKGFGKASDFRARRVHVIGAGVMGGDIAAWCVVQGLEVTLQDREMKYIEPAIKRARGLFKKRLKTPPRINGAMGRLIPDVDGLGVARADVIIEAIFENADAKRELFRDLEPRMKDDAILATNTSAIPLAELKDALDRPERLIGLHFFNPVAKMPLVEVVHDDDTPQDEIDRGAAFCGQISRYPLPVESSPGFLVNRVLAPYMQNAFRLHRERNIPKEALDKAARDFGMPMGPVELADTVGLDVGLSVISMLGGTDAEAEREVLKSLVDAGKLGKKSGEGFYRWEKGKPVKDDEAAKGHDLRQLAEQLMKPYFEECRACLGDGIVADADVLDAGMVFGTGFAPFRGGPLHYLRTEAEPAPEGGEQAPEPTATQPTAEENAEAARETGSGEKAEAVADPEPGAEAESKPEPKPAKKKKKKKATSRKKSAAKSDADAKEKNDE